MRFKLSGTRSISVIFKLYLFVLLFFFLASSVYKFGDRLPSKVFKVLEVVAEQKGIPWPHQNPCKIKNGSFDSRCVRSFEKDIATLCSHTDGRLGNQMFAYATLYALGIYNKRPAHMSPVMSDYLTKYYEVNLDTLEDNLFSATHWKPISLTSKSPTDLHELPKKDQSGEATRIKFTDYPIFWKYFHEFRSQILNEFKFHDEVKSLAEGIIHSAIKKLYPHFALSDVTVIGVHVRRGDYALVASNLRVHMPTTNYYSVAMTLLAEKVENALYILASDDIPWCKVAFSNLTSKFMMHFLEPNSERDGGGGYDLAVLSNCHHIIYGIGTFGFWAGYYSSGVVIYCSDCEKDTPWMSKNGIYGGEYENAIPPWWIGIPNNPATEINRLQNFTIQPPGL